MTLINLERRNDRWRALSLRYLSFLSVLGALKAHLVDWHFCFRAPCINFLIYLLTYFCVCMETNLVPLTGNVLSQHPQDSLSLHQYNYCAAVTSVTLDSAASNCLVYCRFEETWQLWDDCGRSRRVLMSDWWASVECILRLLLMLLLLPRLSANWL